MSEARANGSSFRTISENKRLLAILAIAIMAAISFTAVCISDDSDAASTTTIEDDGLYYKISGAKATVVNCYIGTYNGDIVIKSSVSYNSKNYPVTNIDDGAFEGCTGITSVTVPSSVTTIGMQAFDGCTGITSIVLPEVTELSGQAFEGCTNLTSISMPKIEIIGEKVFAGCTGLTAITLPSTTETVYGSAFMDCSSLASIAVENGNEYFTSVDGVLYRTNDTLTLYPAGKTDTSYTLPSYVCYIDDFALYKCVNITAFYVENGNPVFIAEDGILFYNNGVKIIYAYPAGSTQSSYTFNHNETIINYNALSGASHLTSVTIPATVTQICEYAFAGCTGLTDITIPETVSSTSTYSNTFRDCTNLITASISCPKIDEDMFTGCTKLTTINIGKEVTSIGEIDLLDPAQIFNKCPALQNIIVDENNTNYKSVDGVLYSKDGYYLYACPVTKTGSFTVPNTVHSIYSYAFSGCAGLTSVTMSSPLDQIRYHAFEGCTGLTSITIPETVIDLAEDAFIGCTSVTSYSVNEGSSTFSGYNGVLFNYELTTLLLYPAGKSETSYDIPSLTESVGSYAFYGCSKLTSVKFHQLFNTIGIGAFYGCTGLTSLDSLYSVVSIGNDAFYGCTGLTSITMPSTLYSINGKAFYGCTNLTEITFSSSSPAKVDADIPFAAGSENLRLIVPAAAYSTYANKWTQYIPNLCCSITEATIGEITAQTYTGTEITPDITVTIDTITLVEDTDYTVSYEDNINAGDAKAIVTGIGIYFGSISKVFVISQKEVTVKADDASKIFSESDPTLTATVTGLIGTDTVDYTLARAAGENVGTYAITASGDASQGNYSVTFENGTFTVTPKAVVVKANDVSKNISETDPELTATVTGLVGADTVSYTLTRAAGEDAGKYIITASGDAAQGNYSVTYQSGTFTIVEPASSQSDWSFWVWIIPIALFIIHMLVWTYDGLKKD